LQRSSTLLNEFAEAEDAVSDHALLPKGMLRVTSSLSFAMIYLAPTLDSNGGQAIRGAALAGGILIQPLYIVQGNISDSKLVPVLMDWELPVLIMNIAYPNRVRLPAKIRCSRTPWSITSASIPMRESE